MVAAAVVEEDGRPPLPAISKVTTVVLSTVVQQRVVSYINFLLGQADLRQKAGKVTTFQMYRRYTHDSLLERDGRPVNDPAFFLVYFYV